MSFSGEVKEELARHMGKGRHCQIAELAAIFAFGGDTPLAEPENPHARRKRALLLKELFGIEDGVIGHLEKRVFETVRMWDGETETTADSVDGILIQQTCCRRAYLRGAFLAGGSISDPQKSYHFEIVSRNLRQAAQLMDVMNGFGLEAKTVTRKKHRVVYVKEGARIVDLLNMTGAHVALMNLENVRILKEMRNSVNRRVNCETANISKTVDAAVRQLKDIEYIRDTAGLSSLPDNLRETAALRLEYPDAPLKELGTYLSPPVGKSGVNHRLRRISEIAEQLRG